MRACSLKNTGPRAAPLLPDAALEQLRRAATHHRWRRHTADRLAGIVLGRHRGDGLDMLESRPYQPGDDVRHMDWRATARSGRPMTRVFLAEQRRDLFLVIDRRPSMMFGTRRELKAAAAARIAALLAFRFQAELGAVSGLVVGEETTAFAPARSLGGLLPLLRAAAAPPTIAGAAPMPQPTPPPGTSLVIISDFHDVLVEGRPLAAHLPASGRHATTAIRIVDRAERELPAAGLLRLAGAGGEAVLIDTDDPDIRRQFRAAAIARDRRFTEACKGHGVTPITIDSGTDVLPQVARLL